MGRQGVEIYLLKVLYTKLCAIAYGAMFQKLIQSYETEIVETISHTEESELKLFDSPNPIESSKTMHAPSHEKQQRPILDEVLSLPEDAEEVSDEDDMVIIESQPASPNPEEILASDNNNYQVSFCLHFLAT